MAYSTQNGRRPHEYASKAAHSALVNDPAVQAFLAQCRRPPVFDHQAGEKDDHADDRSGHRQVQPGGNGFTGQLAKQVKKSRCSSPVRASTSQDPCERSRSKTTDMPSANWWRWRISWTFCGWIMRCSVDRVPSEPKRRPGPGRS